jgi:hypothetical protein
MSDVWNGPCKNCSATGKMEWGTGEFFSDLCANCEGLIRDGILIERERIIKAVLEWGECGACYCCATDVAAMEVIDIIKGENK